MRVGEIGDVNVVAHAGAVRSRVVVAEDRRCLALLEAIEQHRDEVQDGRVFELDGAAAGDIEVAQSAEPNAVRLLTGTRHPFAEQLGLAVWVDRNHRFDVFGHHIDRRHAVGCGGRGEDELLGVLGLGHAGEHVEHAVDVLLVVPQRLLHGFADLLAGCEVDDGVHILGLHDLGETFAGSRCRDVHAVEACVADAIGLAVAQVVDYDDVFAGFVQCMDDVRADVAAAACDKNSHVKPFLTAGMNIGMVEMYPQCSYMCVYSVTLEHYRTQIRRRCVAWRACRFLFDCRGKAAPAAFQSRGPPDECRPA